MPLMKTIGIIGGLGPPSTVKYYEWLNDGVQAALGNNHSAKIILTSVDGEEVKGFRLSGDSKGEGEFYAREARRLEQAGAEGIILGCTELTLLTLPKVRSPLFDTTRIHVEAALEYALA